MDTIYPIKAFRERLELSQQQLADLLGVARETISRWETGARKIDGDLLHRVVERTGIPATELRPDLAKLLAAE
jgi:transcriptional regulator with XRE-family HTH domain